MAINLKEQKNMKINPNTFEGVKTPIYILEENRLRRNLSLISRVAHEAEVEIILAFKAFYYFSYNLHSVIHNLFEI